MKNSLCLTAFCDSTIWSHLTGGNTGAQQESHTTVLAQLYPRGNGCLGSFSFSLGCRSFNFKYNFVCLFVSSQQDQFNFNNLVTVWIQKGFVQGSTPSHTQSPHKGCRIHTQLFSLSSKHYSRVAQRAWLLGPVSSHYTILTQVILYNKKLCTPAKRQKNTRTQLKKNR